MPDNNDTHLKQVVVVVEEYAPPLEEPRQLSSSLWSFVTGRT